MNNVYPKLPARMDDGRALSLWDPTAVINEKIRRQEGIKTNREYREYLQKNGLHIMKINQNMAYQNIGISMPYKEPVPSIQSNLQDTYESSLQKLGNLFSF
jgi:hypothetical protein